MKLGVVVFPGSNCDRDMQDALQQDLNKEVIMLWHKDKDLSAFSTEDCIVLPGGSLMEIICVVGLSHASVQ